MLRNRVGLFVDWLGGGICQSFCGHRERQHQHHLASMTSTSSTGTCIKPTRYALIHTYIHKCIGPTRNTFLPYILPSNLYTQCYVRTYILAYIPQCNSEYMRTYIIHTYIHKYIHISFFTYIHMLVT